MDLGFAAVRDPQQAERRSRLLVDQGLDVVGSDSRPDVVALTCSATWARLRWPSTAANTAGAAASAGGSGRRRAGPAPAAGGSPSPAPPRGAARRRPAPGPRWPDGRRRAGLRERASPRRAAARIHAHSGMIVEVGCWSAVASAVASMFWVMIASCCAIAVAGSRWSRRWPLRRRQSARRRWRWRRRHRRSARRCRGRRPGRR